MQLCAHSEFAYLLIHQTGGEGFILQRLTGEGDAFIKAGGALIRRELRDGETLKVTGGSLVAFAPTVSYDVQMVKGVKNIMMGGEGKKRLSSQVKCMCVSWVWDGA